MEWKLSVPVRLLYVIMPLHFFMALKLRSEWFCLLFWFTFNWVDLFLCMPNGHASNTLTLFVNKFWEMKHHNVPLNIRCIKIPKHFHSHIFLYNNKWYTVHLRVYQFSIFNFFSIFNWKFWKSNYLISIFSNKIFE